MKNGFEWDEAKRVRNLVKHGIDFIDAKEGWEHGAIEIRSDQEHGETRWLAIGKAGGKFITVVYTYRREKKRIISARIARNYERKYYDNETGGRS